MSGFSKPLLQDPVSSLDRKDVKHKSKRRRLDIVGDVDIDNSIGN